MSDDEQGMALTALDEQAEQQIRRVLHEGRWFFSVIDVVGLLTGSLQPRTYWAVLKRRLSDEGANELLTTCKQLKMQAADGKQRLTDAADAETMLRIIQSIPSPKAEPFKAWMARVGRERLEDEGREFAILTDILHHGTFEFSTDDHKAIKSLKKRDNLRDSMTSLELALTMLSEAAATTIHQARDSQGFTELQQDTHEAGEVGGAARRDIEARSGQPAVSAENYKSLTARAQQAQLFGGTGLQSVRATARDEEPLAPGE